MNASRDTVKWVVYVPAWQKYLIIIKQGYNFSRHSVSIDFLSTFTGKINPLRMILQTADKLFEQSELSGGYCFKVFVEIEPI